MVEVFDEAYNYSCPWYIRAMMDFDTVHMTVQDLTDPESPESVESVVEDSVNFNSSLICYLLTPAVIRQLGINPSGLYTLKGYKEKAMDLFRSIAPVEIKNSTGTFRKRIQRFLNETLNSLYNSFDLDEAKSLVRGILDLMGADYSLEAVDVQEVLLYNTSYLSYVKVFYILGLFDPEEFRYENCNTHYVKKVPNPSLWDYRDFLKSSADFISARFYRSFLICKDNPSDKEWVRLYNEAERRFSLIVNKLVVKVPSVTTRNQKGEIWELRLLDFFKSELKKKLIVFAEEIPQGSLREEFTEFHLPEEVQKILNPRVVFRPWVKIK